MQTGEPGLRGKRLVRESSVSGSAEAWRAHQTLFLYHQMGVGLAGKTSSKDGGAWAYSDLPSPNPPRQLQEGAGGEKERGPHFDLIWKARQQVDTQVGAGGPRRLGSCSSLLGLPDSGLC